MHFSNPETHFFSWLCTFTYSVDFIGKKVAPGFFGPSIVLSFSADCRMFLTSYSATVTDHSDGVPQGSTTRRGTHKDYIPHTKLGNFDNFCELWKLAFLTSSFMVVSLFFVCMFSIKDILSSVYKLLLFSFSIV